MYAVKLFVRDRDYDGVVNIGMRPTFDTRTPAIEVHIFDFDEDIYGEEITVYFIQKIREEKKFRNAEELTVQIKKDIIKSKKILSESNSDI